MIALSSLWLPILLSAVFVFITSSILHMVIQMHSKDYSVLPGEEAVRDALRAQNISPGMYTFPHCKSMKEMGSDEFVAKMNQGPNGFMTIIPTGPMAMGRTLVLWFAFSILISVVVGYVSTMTVESGATFKEVFRIAGTVALLGYAIPKIDDSIWKAARWSVTIKFVFDGILYSLVTAATFAWLWP